LLSDAGQKDQWSRLKPFLTAGKALYFSHGFSIVFKDQTDVVPPPDIDVILVAPKGSGTTVRRHFLEGKGINASYAIHQDATGWPAPAGPGCTPPVRRRPSAAPWTGSGVSATPPSRCSRSCTTRCRLATRPAASSKQTAARTTANSWRRN